MLEERAEKKRKKELLEKQQKEEQEKAEQQAKLEAERIRAASELQNQFDRANQSMYSDALKTDESMSQADQNESVILHDRSLLLNELEGQMTPRETTIGGVRQPRKSIFIPVDSSFYSEAGEIPEESFTKSHQSYGRHASESGDEAG